MQKLKEMQAELLKLNINIANLKVKIDTHEILDDNFSDALDNMYHDMSHLNEEYFNLTKKYIPALEDKLNILVPKFKMPKSTDRSLGGRSGKDILGGMIS